MKGKEFSELLTTLAEYLRGVGPSSSSSALLQCVPIFELVPSKSVSDVVSALKVVSVSDASFLTEDLRPVAKTVQASAELVKKIGKVAVAADLELFANFLDANSRSSAAQFVPAALDHLRSFSPTPKTSKSKKSPADIRPLREDLVDRYLRAFEVALGDDPGFRDVMARLEGDVECGTPEFVAIAKRFSLATVKTRPAAIKKILERHLALVTSRARSAATAGRIAG